MPEAIEGKAAHSIIRDRGHEAGGAAQFDEAGANIRRRAAKIGAKHIGVLAFGANRIGEHIHAGAAKYGKTVSLDSVQY